MENKWEYLVLGKDSKDLWVDYLNKYGTLGWELVQIVQKTGGSPTVIFKRKLPENK